MGIRQRLTKQQIKDDFDWYALVFGFAPCYVGDIEGECKVCVMNWVPEFVLDIGEALYYFYCMMFSHEECLSPIRLVKKIP